MAGKAVKQKKEEQKKEENKVFISEADQYLFEIGRAHV